MSRCRADYSVIGPGSREVAATNAAAAGHPEDTMVYALLAIASPISRLGDVMENKD